MTVSPAPEVLPPDPDESVRQGFVTEAEELTRTFARSVCMASLAMTLGIGAYDLIQGHYHPHAAHTLVLEQAALSAVLLAYIVTPMATLRRLGFFRCTGAAAIALTVVFGYAVGALMPFASYLLMALCMTPFISVPLLLPLRWRLAVVGLIGAGPLAGFSLSFAGHLDPTYAGHTLGLWLVAVTASVVGGDALYRTAFDAYSSRRIIERQKTELVVLCDQLQGRVSEQTDELRGLASHIDGLIESERKRFAADLHDDFGQELTGMRLELAVLVLSLASSPGSTRLQRVSSSLDRIHDKMRRVVSSLRPKVLEEGGLVRGVEWLIIQQSGAAVIRLDAALPEEPATAPALVAYRIVQEALTNVARHAQAAHVTIGLAVDGYTLLVRVEDDGIGLQTPADPSAHHGITGMHERAMSVDGAVNFEQVQPRGTRVLARLPMAWDAHSVPPPDPSG